MWTLKIKQTQPKEGYTFDDKPEVVFESENIEKLLNIIEYMSCIKSQYETEFLIQKKEVKADE